MLHVITGTIEESTNQREFVLCHLVKASRIPIIDIEWEYSFLTLHSENMSLNTNIPRYKSTYTNGIRFNIEESNSFEKAIMKISDTIQEDLDSEVTVAVACSIDFNNRYTRLFQQQLEHKIPSATMLFVYDFFESFDIRNTIELTDFIQDHEVDINDPVYTAYQIHRRLEQLRRYT